MSNLVIKRPIISEKSFALASTGVYVFLVENSANKRVIATQVHEMYNVDVEEVRIINIPGKVKRSGKKIGRRSDIKKALVKIKKGQKISIFEEEDKEVKKADKLKVNKADQSAVEKVEKTEIKSENK